MQTTSALRKFVLALTAAMLILASVSWAADEQSDIDKRLDTAATVLNQIMATPDNAIPDNVMEDAECVAVVPSMIEVALGFGGKHGKGVATCRTASGWSAPAPFSITGGSWGLQIGGQAVDLVMLVMNKDGMDNLLSSKFKIGANASASAGPVGRHAAAGTDWKMKAQVLTYSRSRGVFAGVDLSGSAITQDEDETRLLYGKMVPFREILSGEVPAPKSSGEFLAAVRKYSAQAKQSGSNATSGNTQTASAAH